MKICLWCEGKKVVGCMEPSKSKTVSVLGKLIPLAEIIDKPCPVCNATGQITEQLYTKLRDKYYDNLEQENSNEQNKS